VSRASVGPAFLPADWPAPPGVHAFTTLRHGLGVSSPPFDYFNLGNRYAADGDDPATVERNRALLVESAGLPSAPHWLKQVHGIDVVRCDGSPGEGHEPIADASVTATPGTVLAILTADCLPVVFAAEDGREVAAAHAGWPGLSSGMLEATVAAMHTPADRLIAWIGPAAGPQRYEIGAEVRDRFLAQDARAEVAFVPTRPGHWRVDLFAIARMRLAQAGVTRVHGGDLCTISDPQRFFSHRRDARTGRMATLVWFD
jgi:polyphenol oxidase